jgi:hypothetical protein
LTERPLINKTSQLIIYLAITQSNTNNDDEYLEIDTEVESYILSTIEQRIRKSNSIVAEKIVKKHSKRVKVIVFKKGQIVILAIDQKL